MIHIVKAFSIVNESEVDVFLEFFCFLLNPTDVGNLISSLAVVSCYLFCYFPLKFKVYKALGKKLVLLLDCLVKMIPTTSTVHSLFSFVNV